MRVRPFKLNAFEGVGAGQVAYTKLPNGPTYQEIVIASNVSYEYIEKVTIDLGGIHQVGEIIEMTGNDLHRRNNKIQDLIISTTLSEYSHKDSAGDWVYEKMYVIPLGSEEAMTDVGKMLSGLVTLPNDNILLKVALKSGLTSDDTEDGKPPRLTAYAYASASRTERTIIPLIKSHHISVPGQGELDYMNIPADPGIEYRRWWLFTIDNSLQQSGSAYGNVELDTVEIWKDGVREFEEPQWLTEYMQRRAGMSTDSQRYCIDFVRGGWVMADTFKPQHRYELKLRMGVTAQQEGNLRLLTEGFKVVKAQS